MEIVFAGTPQFAATILRALRTSNHRVLAVLTQPDRRAGRGRSMRASDVKREAEDAGYPVHQPSSLRGAETLELLEGAGADAMVVAAYGLILPPAVLELFPFGCINVHASLLPRWRGAAPVQRAILAGDTHTGVSIMRMDRGLDTGDVYSQTICPINADDTAGSLQDRLAALGCQTLLKALDAIERGDAVAAAQDHAAATYARKLDKQEARIDWSESATQLERRVRAYQPWPVAYTEVESQSARIRIRVHEAEALDTTDGQCPGEVVRVGTDFIDVACGGGGRLRLRTLQRAGRQVVGAAEFLRGTPVKVGERMR